MVGLPSWYHPHGYDTDMNGASDALISALRTAVENALDNHDLRAHLAEVLFGANRAQEALEESTQVLREVPDHHTALKIAAEAAEKLGEVEKAKRYRRLFEALDGIEPDAADEPVPDSDDRDTAQPDRFVRLRLVKGGTSTDAYNVAEAELKIADVAGLDAVKRRLELSLFAPMRNPEMRKYFGRSMRGGLLLYGPPGCGKTFIARATAGELGARFLSVGLHEVLDMYLGESERKLHELFETARRNRPCLMFIDEIDALGRKRSLQRHSAGRDLVNQLLAEMDSVDTNNDGLFVLAATNHPWDVDTALRRPGRFDRMIFVGPPDAVARKSILAFHMRGRVTDQLDLRLVSKLAEGFSGADLAHLCDTAAETAMEDSLKRGQARPIQQKDFTAALKEVKPSTKPWLETARNYAMFANEGGVYDDLVDYLRTVRMLQK
jgi:SpoVK/Ycf46/Vps4 family AAA+-type ATPase